MIFDIDIASLPAFFPNPRFFAGMVLAYGFIYGLIILISRVLKLFTDVDSAHEKLDEHKKQIKEYMEKIDTKIEEIRSEMSEVYKFLIPPR